MRVVLNILSIWVEHIGTVPKALSWEEERKWKYHLSLTLLEKKMNRFKEAERFSVYARAGEKIEGRKLKKWWRGKGELSMYGFIVGRLQSNWMIKVGEEW